MKKIHRRTRAQAIELLSKNFHHNGECMEWAGQRTRAGYGVVSFEGGQHYVHRLSFEASHGEIPQGHGVLHRCDNPPCFNPAHLFSGTQKDNGADMVAKGRARNGGFFGSMVGTAVLDEGRVLEIRRLRREGFSYAKIGRIFGLGSTTILNACAYGWVHVPGRIPVSRTSKKFTREEVEEIKTLVLSGANDCQIGRILGVKNGTVCKMRIRNGWKATV